MSRGNSIIVDPSGSVLAGPLIGETGILYAEIDAAQARVSRLEFDVVGHYSRPDVFHLAVNRGTLRTLRQFTGAAPCGP